MLHNVTEPPAEKAKRLAAAAKESESAEVRNDALLKTLQAKTPAQVTAWVDANVNSLADAKTVLTFLAKAVIMLSRE